MENWYYMLKYDEGKQKLDILMEGQKSRQLRRWHGENGAYLI